MSFSMPRVILLNLDNPKPKVTTLARDFKVLLRLASMEVFRPCE